MDAVRRDRDQLVVLRPPACRACRAVSAATGRKRRRRSGRLSCRRGPARWRGWRPGSTCRPRPCRWRWRSSVRPGCDAVSAMRASSTPGIASAAARKSCSSASRLGSSSPVASTISVATPPASLRERMRARFGERVEAAQRIGWSVIAGDIGSPSTLATVFRSATPPIRVHEHLIGAGRAGSRPVQPTPRDRGARHDGGDEPPPERQRPPARGASRPGAGAGRPVAVGQRRLARGFPAAQPGALRRRRRRRGFPGRPDRSIFVWARARLSSASGWSSPPSTRSRPASAASSPASAATARRSGRASA